MTIHSSEQSIDHFSIRSDGENAKFVEYTPPFDRYLGTYKAPEGNYYVPDIFVEFCESAEEFERIRAYEKILYLLHERFWSRDARIVERTKALLFERSRMASEGVNGLTVEQYDTRGLKRYSFGLIYISPRHENQRVFIGYTRLYKPQLSLRRAPARPEAFVKSIPRFPDALLSCEMSTISPNHSPYTASVFIPAVTVRSVDVPRILAYKLDTTSLQGGDVLLDYVSGIIVLKRKQGADAFNW